MIILPSQEFDPIFDDSSEWSNDIPQQPTFPRGASRFHKRGSADSFPTAEPTEPASSRFHKRGSADSLPTAEPTEPASSRFHKRSSADSLPTAEPMASAASRFHRRDNRAVSASPTSEGLYSGTQPQTDDRDDLFPLEDVDGPLSSSEDLFGDDPDNHSEVSFDEFESPEKNSFFKSFAGFFILAALLVIAVCGTFLIKNKLSKGENLLSLDSGTKQTSATTPTTVSNKDASEKTTTTQPTETQTTTAAAPRYPTLKMGDKNADVKKMQDRLLKLGYIGEESCTGYFGDYTQKVVKRFQKKAGLTETGIADNETLTRLYADDAPKWR